MRKLLWVVGAIAGAIAVLVAVYALWSFVNWQMNEGHKDALTLFAQIIGGVVLAVGVFLTYKRVAAAEDAVRVAERNVAIAQEGQISERFTRAIEQLGSKDNLAVRLGGIYALERIEKFDEAFRNLAK